MKQDDASNNTRKPLATLLMRSALICATAAVFTAAPYSIRTSNETAIAVVADQAQARVGRPATPGSVAGVARRTTRRTVRRHMYHGAPYYHHHGCAYVRGVRVCH